MVTRARTRFVAQNGQNKHDIDGLVPERRNSIANALELRLSCINPSICFKEIDVR